MNNKVALVTGGASGIGASTAIEFAKQNVAVVIADVLEKGEETRDQIVELGGNAIFVKCNVGKYDEQKNLMDEIIRKYGRLDYAFNNAGIEQKESKIADVDEATWDRLMNVNLKGVWLGMKLQIPYMIKQGGGAIVNTSSIAGLKSLEGMGVYNCTKAGMIMLTRTAAREYGQYGIRINAVCPGLIITDMVRRLSEGKPGFQEKTISEIPMQRAGQPEEIAKLVVWLAKEGSYITGQALVEDGGWVA